MALTLTQDQIKRLIKQLEKSSSPVPTSELVAALKK